MLANFQSAALRSHNTYMKNKYTAPHCNVLMILYMKCVCTSAIWYICMGCQFQCTLIRAWGLFENNNEYSADDMRALACMS